MTSEPISESPASNNLRLSLRQWAAVALAVCLLAYAVPAAWQQVEPLDAGPDYRIPYSLGNDYWAIQRHIAESCTAGKMLVVGDSVVWGHYVDRQQTLSHFLNREIGSESFANLGVDGIHPAALLGLVEHYGRSIQDRQVILHCNLLWMSSPRHDLQEEKEFTFNHPQLVPQFFPRIPCYRESLSGRLGNVIGREVSLLGWIRHVQIAYFDGDDLPLWTLDHPYESPASQVTFRLPSPDEPPSPQPVARPWTQQGIGRFAPAWVELKESFQWQCFCRTVDLLKRRRNHVFVVLGPFNEHMLEDKSLEVYQSRRREAETWFQEHAVASCIAPLLPSDHFADASHPLQEGYRLLAEQLLNDESYRTFCRSRLPGGT